MTRKSEAGAAYVRFVLEHLDITPSRLAKRAGISSSTLTRMLNDPDYKFTLSLSTLDKIEGATNVSYTPFFLSKDAAEMSQAPIRGITSGFVEQMRTLDLTPITGRVASGIWYEVGRPIYPPLRFLPMKLAQSNSLDDEPAFAMEVGGNSINKLANDGDFLICERLRSKIDAYIGGLVIVERRSSDRRLVEMTARLFSKSHSQWIFEPCTTDSGSEAPLMVPVADGVDNEDGEVRVVAVANFVFRHIRSANAMIC